MTFFCNVESVKRSCSGQSRPFGFETQTGSEWILKKKKLSTETCLKLWGLEHLSLHLFQISDLSIILSQCGHRFSEVFLQYKFLSFMLHLWFSFFQVVTSLSQVSDPSARNETSHSVSFSRALSFPSVLECAAREKKDIDCEGRRDRLSLELLDGLCSCNFSDGRISFTPERDVYFRMCENKALEAAERGGRHSGRPHGPHHSLVD